MKFIYCPKCKELRVKPWYSMRGLCARCREEGREIRVRGTALTYALYGMMGVVFALVYLYTKTDDIFYLIGSVIGLIVSFIIQGVELARGERRARAKIRTTKSDAAASRQRGRGL